MMAMSAMEKLLSQRQQDVLLEKEVRRLDALDAAKNQEASG